MESSDTDPQLELLAKLHNDLVDLKKILVETQLADPSASESLKTQLSQIIAGNQHLDGTHAAPAASPHQKVIAPTDTNIEPGEGREK